MATDNGSRVRGSHQGLYPNWSENWQTPQWLIDALGPFDMDPCAHANAATVTATRMLTLERDGSGFLHPWVGRVWLNPPYGRTVGDWIQRLADHGDGIALVYARTDTQWFHREVLRRANAMLFVEGRLHFLRDDGSPAVHNSGGPSVLIAYGRENVNKLFSSGIEGYVVVLR